MTRYALPFLSLCLCGQLVYTQEPEAAATSESTENDSPSVLVENAPDNSGGFAVFSKQLEPLPQDPVPVQVIRRAGQGSMHSSNREMPGHWAGINEEGETVVASLTRTYTDAIVQEPSKNNAYHMSGRESSVELLAREIDLEDKWEELVKTLQATGERDQRHWQRRQLLQNPGSLLIFAVRLHQAGHEDKANQIASFLFEETGKKNVLLAGMSEIVDAHYQDLLHDYQRDGDAEAFVDAAKQLLDTRGKYWLSASTLREHLADWEEALAMEPDAIPAAGEDLLSEKHKTLYTRLIADPYALSLVQDVFQQGNWLLTPPSLVSNRIQMQTRMMAYSRRPSSKKDQAETEEQAEDAAEEEAPSEPDVEALRKLVLDLHGLGFDALPLFRVMLEDKRFIPPQTDSASGMGFYRHRMMRQIHTDNSQSFTVPSQYRDVARATLQNIKPAEARWQMDSPESLSAELDLFIDSHRDKSRIELARLYLDLSSSWSIPQEAMYTLLASEDEDNRKIVLDMADNLENGRVHSLLQVFMDYAEQRPEEAAPALRRMRDALTSSEEPDRMGGQQFIDQTVKQIDALLQDPEAEETEEAPDLAEALNAWIDNGNPQSPSHLQTVMTAAGGVSEETLQQVFAEKVRTAPLSASMQLMQTFFGIVRNGGPTRVRHGGMHHNEQMKYYLNPEADAFPAETPGMSGVAPEMALEILPDIWLPLLSPGDDQGARIIAQALVANLLVSLGEEGYKLMWAIRPDLSGESFEKALALGRDMLRDPDGEWAEKLPSADEVDDARAEEILTTLKEGDAEAIGKLLDALTLPERLLLLSERRGELSLENDARFQGLVPRRLRLVMSHSETGDHVVENLSMDEPLTREKLRTLMQHAQTLAQQGKTGIITLQSGIFLDGMGLNHMEAMLQPYQLPNDPGIQIQGSLGNEHFQAHFEPEADIRFDPPKPKDAPKDEQEDLMDLFTGEAEDETEQLSSGIDAFFTAPIGPLSSYGQINITYKAVPETDEEETP